MKNIPIGTTIFIKKYKFPLLIIGYNFKEQLYIACPYPQGYVSDNALYKFKYEDINIICSLGFISNEFEEFISNK